MVNEFQLLLQNRVSVTELILWREIRLNSYKMDIGEEDEDQSDPQKYYQQLLTKNSSLPPGAIVSIQRMMNDERYLMDGSFIVVKCLFIENVFLI